MSKGAIGFLYSAALISQIILAIIFFSFRDNYNSDFQKIATTNIQVAQEGPNSFVTISEPGTGSLAGPVKTETAQQYLADLQQDLNQTQQAMIAVLVFMGLVGILAMIAWINTLINLSRGRQWVWFVLTFFFGGIMLFIYLIGGPAVPKKQSPVAQMSASPQENYLPGVQLQQGAVSLQPPPPPTYQQPGPQAYKPHPSALEVLQLRLARGEIDEQTYQRLRDMLKS